jgi:hypothetical protein
MPRSWCSILYNAPPNKVLVLHYHSGTDALILTHRTTSTVIMQFNLAVPINPTNSLVL